MDAATTAIGQTAREARGIGAHATGTSWWARMPDPLRRLHRWLTYRPERRYMRRRSAA